MAFTHQLIQKSTKSTTICPFQWEEDCRENNACDVHLVVCHSGCPIFIAVGGGSSCFRHMLTSYVCFPYFILVVMISKQSAADSLNGNLQLYGRSKLVLEPSSHLFQVNEAVFIIVHFRDAVVVPLRKLYVPALNTNVDHWICHFDSYVYCLTPLYGCLPNLFENHVVDIDTTWHSCLLRLWHQDIFTSQWKWQHHYVVQLLQLSKLWKLCSIQSPFRMYKAIRNFLRCRKPRFLGQLSPWLAGGHGNFYCCWQLLSLAGFARTSVFRLPLWKGWKTDAVGWIGSGLSELADLQEPKRAACLSIRWLENIKYGGCGWMYGGVFLSPSCRRLIMTYLSCDNVYY